MVSLAIREAWLAWYFMYFVGIAGAAVAAKVFPTRSARRTRDIICTAAVFLAQAVTLWLLFHLPPAARHSASAHGVLQASFAVTACLLIARLLIRMRLTPASQHDALGDVDDLFLSLDRFRGRDKRMRIGDIIVVVSRYQITIPAGTGPQVTLHAVLVTAAALGAVYILEQLNLLYGKLWMSGSPHFILMPLLLSPARILFTERRRGSIWVAEAGLFVNGTNVGSPSAATMSLEASDAGMSVMVQSDGKDAKRERVAIFENVKDAEQVGALISAFLRRDHVSEPVSASR